MKRAKIRRMLSAAILAVLIATLSASPALCQEAAAENVVDFGFQKMIAPKLEMDECIVRARYLLQVPDETEYEIIAETYLGYEKVHLIEYGYFNMIPVIQSYYVCVGVKEDGEMEILPTPMDVAKRIYDFGAFDGMIVEYVKETVSAQISDF